MIKKILPYFLLVALFSGCLKGKENNTNTGCQYDPCYYKAPTGEIQAVQDYLTSKGITNAQQHCSGLFYVIENPGTGKQPTACSVVDVDYRGSLTNGTQFDEGFNYQSDFAHLILGWANGVPLIKEGGIIHLYIPPSFGYGNQPYGTIPANSILIFDIKLNTVL